MFSILLRGIYRAFMLQLVAINSPKLLTFLVQSNNDGKCIFPSEIYFNYKCVCTFLVVRSMYVYLR